MLRVLILLLIVSIAHADDERRPPRGGDVDVDVDTTVKTPVDVDVSTPVEVGVDAPVNVNTEITRRGVQQVPDAYFSYTPNFIDCGRVLGFQFGNTSGIGSFGVPLPRDKACDIWKAVNEAQENGHILLSYAFMCEIRNIKKVWGLERCQEITDTAGQWWIAMAKGDTETVAETIARFEPPDSVVIAQEQHSELEEELEQTKAQLGSVQREYEQQQQQQQQVQQKIEQYEQREAQRQVALDEFLQQLESRDGQEENE